MWYGQGHNVVLLTMHKFCDVERSCSYERENYSHEINSILRLDYSFTGIHAKLPQITQIWSILINQEMELYST